MAGLLQRLWPSSSDRSGRTGEAIASRHLEAKGLVILARNFRCRSGEVDIVARDGDVTVFVEVKERHGRTHGEGFEAVTFGKRRRLIRAARMYAAARDLSETPIRFDVVSVDWPETGGAACVRHDASAFGSDAL